MQEPSDSRTEWTDPGWHWPDRYRPAADRIGELAESIPGASSRGRTSLGRGRRGGPPRAGRRDPPPLPGPVADGRAQARRDRRRRFPTAPRRGWATTGSSAKSAGAAWVSSTRPSKSRWAVASPSRSWARRACAIPEQLLRFQREARAAAKLHHTNIVPVFGVGESEGVHYYVMQFIPGLGLDAVLQGDPAAPGSGAGAECRLVLCDPSRPCPSGRHGALAADGPILTRTALPRNTGIDWEPGCSDAAPRLLRLPRPRSCCPASPSDPRRPTPTATLPGAWR